MLNDHDLAKFMANLPEDRDPEKCWEWQGSRLMNSYGRLHLSIKYTLPRKTVRTHRIAYELWVGEIPDGLFVCHHCDNPPCLNPDHLFVGTAADNIHDQMQKGRMGLGEDSARAILTEKQVVRAREIYAEGDRSWTHISKIGREIGASYAATYAIVKNKTWRHLLPLPETQDAPET